MNLEIVEREEQDLMNREEITVEISHTGEPTPSAAAVRDKIAAELDLDPKTVEIASIHSSTGLSTSTGTVRVHDEPIFEELPEEDEGDETEDSGEEDVEADDEEESDAAEDNESGEEAGEEEETDEEPEDDTDTDAHEDEEEDDGEDEKEGDA
ncbi:MAG: hypothetical protein ABEI97_02070 [Candidatus Nanohaloarchaea archaeon]